MASASFTGCTFLPSSIQLLSSIKTGLDTVAILSDEKTINDHIVYQVTGADCKTRSWIESFWNKNKQYCVDKKLINSQ